MDGQTDDSHSSDTGSFVPLPTSEFSCREMHSSIGRAYVRRHRVSRATISLVAPQPREEPWNLGSAEVRVPRLLPRLDLVGTLPTTKTISPLRAALRAYALENAGFQKVVYVPTCGFVDMPAERATSDVEALS